MKLPWVDIGQGISAVGVFMELIAFLADRFSDYTSGVAEHHHHLVRLCQVLEHIDRHYTEKLSISTLAKMTTVSESNFYRSFASLIGVSAEKYLINLRLSHAKKLLINSDLRISETTGISGFSDSNYFTRLFKSHIGCPLREVRRQTQNS